MQDVGFAVSASLLTLTVLWSHEMCCSTLSRFADVLKNCSAAIGPPGHLPPFRFPGMQKLTERRSDGFTTTPRERFALIPPSIPGTPPQPEPLVSHDPSITHHVKG